jgi:uncharacterized membrane protein
MRHSRGTVACVSFGRVLLFCVTLGLILALPVVARADYSIDQVDIDATLASDGSLSVSETRTFDFDDSYNGVYWKIPTGATSDGRTITTTIDSVGMEVNGDFVPFTQTDDAYNGMDGVYEVFDYGSYLEVKLYHPVDDESASYVVRYTDTNLAVRWTDVGELYWKFVSDGWDVESRDVTCTVHLPIPSGADVLHDGSSDANVRAWGHGPLDAELWFDDEDNVVYNVPGVGSDEFAEARIVFPSEWLSAATTQGGNELKSILSEENAWAEEANARRERARAIGAGIGGVGAFLALFSTVWAFVKRGAYKRGHKPQFDDKYFRDVPSDDHPAVLGALLNDGHPTDQCFTASLMRLTDMGAMDLDLVKYADKGFFGREKEKQDYRLTRKVNKIGADGKKRPKGAAVDDKTLYFVFDRVGKLSGKDKGGRDSEGLPTNADTVYFAEFERAAKEHPSAYSKAWDSWVHLVEGQCESRNFFIDAQKSGRNQVLGLGMADVIAAIAVFFGIPFGVLPALIGFAVLFILVVASVVSFVLASRMKPLSREAIELTAKLKALKAWLKDFTRLEEAWPRDVVLWNKLLVMAVVLDVADEVIDQLKVKAPEILADSYMGPVYGWYYMGGPGMHGSPMKSLNTATASAHQVSSAALAESSSSSGGGGGGGFSGGGGGGFGGGGGGGAF